MAGGATIRAAFGPGSLTTTPRDGIELFAVGCDWAQWIVRDADGVRSVIRRGLAEGARQTVDVDGAGLAELTTLRRPDGRLLGRVATVSDLHVGEVKFGRFPAVASARSIRAIAPDGRPAWQHAHPVRGLRAALAEIDEWAPDLLVVKGDIANDNTEAEYEFSVPLLTTTRSGAPRRVVAVAGNHDGGNHRQCDTDAVMARLGMPPARGVTTHRAGDATVITLDTAVPQHHKGSLHGRTSEVTTALRSISHPALVLAHHQFLAQQLQLYVPRGIPATESLPFLDSVGAANPRTLITSGHTHRHRRWCHGTVELTEVGSTKDFPGTWAGYEIYEEGIVQTVRRIADPEVLAWGERVRRVAFGIWGRWAPGVLDDRCFTTAWSTEKTGG